VKKYKKIKGVDEIDNHYSMWPSSVYVFHFELW